MQVVVAEMVERGAEGGSRTRTSFRTTDFKSGVPALRSLTKRYEAGCTGDAVI